MISKIHQFKINNAQLISMHWSLKSMLENDIDTGYKPELIIATMEFLASKQKRQKSKRFIVMFDPKISLMIWGCVKTVLDNELVPTIDQIDTFYDVLAMLAYELDRK